jgi:hypothetical protein
VDERRTGDEARRRVRRILGFARAGLRIRHPGEHAQIGEVRRTRRAHGGRAVGVRVGGERDEPRIDHDQRAERRLRVRVQIGRGDDHHVIVGMTVRAL